MKVVEDVYVSSNTTSITEDISVSSDTPIFDESHASYEGTSEVVDAIVESGTPLTVDAHVHDTRDSAPELMKSSVSSQISRYLFAILIEDEIDHVTVDSSVVMDHPSPLVLIMII